MAERTFTLKELTRIVARSSDEARNKEAARRVQHWASIGLLTFGGLEPDETGVGRGKVRRYPEQLAYWCALLAAAADRGVPSMHLVALVATLALHQNTAKKRGREDLVAAAMRGEGADVVLVFETPATPELLVFNTGDAPDMEKYDAQKGTRTPRAMISRLPMELPAWEGGAFMNLTEIFSKVRV